MLAFFACSPAPPPPPIGGLVVALASAPQSLDPRFGVDANSSRIGDLLHVGLTRVDRHARRAPSLAARWEQPDPRTLVFHLRSDFAFADGTPLQAADVVATYEAVLDPALASPKRAALAMLEAVEARDSHTVVMRLRAPSPPFLDATGLGVVPAARAGDPSEITVGAGPYRLVRAIPGERFELAPNPGFPEPQPRIDPLVVRIVPDEVVRALELRRGSVQLTQEPVEPETLAWLRSLPTLTVRQGAGSSFHYLALNARDPRLADRRVRRAIAAAIDREALVAWVLGGAARVATGLLAPEHWAYASARVPPHDPELARRLLDRAGHSDPDGPGPATRFRLIYKSSSQLGRRRLAEAMQAQLAAVGVGLDVRTYEWGTLFADVRRGRFELTALAWVGVGDPDLYRLTLHSTMRPPTGYNRGGYASPLMDRLTAAALRATDPTVRRALYARVQRLAARDLPVVPLWWEDRIVVHTRRLEGFVPTPEGSLAGLARGRMALP